MNRDDFITKVAERSGKSKMDAEIIVDSVFEVLAEIMAEREQLKVSGFGTFGTRERVAYTGHDPRNGEKILIAASIMPVFKPSQILKDKVNGRRK